MAGKAIVIRFDGFGQAVTAECGACGRRLNVHRVSAPTGESMRVERIMVDVDVCPECALIKDEAGPFPDPMFFAECKGATDPIGPEPGEAEAALGSVNADPIGMTL